MTGERLEQVVEIIEKYESGNCESYYDLFDLEKDLDIEELNYDIRKKRIQVLFHPDQLKFIPSEYHSRYLKMIDVVKNMIDTFSSERNKENYDNSLSKRTRNNNVNRGYDEDKTEDLDEVNLANAVIINSKKYGLDVTANALCYVLLDGEYTRFTRTGGARDLIINIGREKLYKIISSSSKDDYYPNISSGVMNYLTDLLYKTPDYRKQIGLLEQACAATFLKYDVNTERRQTEYALNKYCKNGANDGFTGDGGARDYLNRYGDWKNADFLIKCALNHERKTYPEYSYSAIENKKMKKKIDNNQIYREMYVEMLSKKMGYGENNSQYNNEGYSNNR